MNVRTSMASAGKKRSLRASHFVAGRGLRSRAKRLVFDTPLTIVQRYLTGPLKRIRNRGRAQRWLEIGPGAERLAGFETLNVTGGTQVDYVANATKRLPFADETFDLIYASHVLEHVPWYQTEATLKEWTRVLKPGGTLEVWVPDGLKIAQAFVRAETEGVRDFEQDGWWRFNSAHDPCRWMAGRIFSYGDGLGTPGHFNWHLALFSERYLMHLMSSAGLNELRRLSRAEVRGYDHGWINLGVAGRKRSGAELRSPQSAI